MKKRVLYIGLILAIAVISIPIGTTLATSHIDYSEPDWKCKKAVGLVELAKKDYPNFVEDTLWLAEKHCGFNVDLLTS